MSIKALLKQMLERNASDLFCRPEAPPHMRIEGEMIASGRTLLTVEDLNHMVDDLTTPKQRDDFKSNLDIDFALYIEELTHRFRVSIFRQRNWPTIVIRNIRDSVSTFEELNLPVEILKKLALESHGLVLLTGSMGSGKSTTIASMIEYINANSSKHILTIDEPIEFTFQDKKSYINQRDLGVDVLSYASALRSLTLQSPDVISIANIRDYNTMAAAMTAAETGVLVLGTLHTINASQSVQRIMNFFPPHQHNEVQLRLSYLLKGVISLRLVPLKDGSGRIPAYEVMLHTPTTSRLIRDGKILEIPRYIEEGEIYGMQSFKQCLLRLIREGKITKEAALDFSDDRDEFSLAINGYHKG